MVACIARTDDMFTRSKRIFDFCPVVNRPDFRRVEEFS
jgi:hypothetical protein